MCTEESPLQFLVSITNPSVKISQNSLQLARIDGPRQVCADLEVIEPIVKMPHIQIIILSQLSRPRSCQVSINSKSIIKRADLGQVHCCSINIEHLSHLSKKRLIGDYHLIIDKFLIIYVFLNKRVPILAIRHHYTILDLDDKGEVSFRQSIVGLLCICLVSKGRKMISLRDLYQFRSVAKWVQSVKLTPCAFQGSVDIRGYNLNGVVSVFISQKLEIIDVIFPQHLAKVFMLSHAYRGKFAPKWTSGVAVIVTVEMVSCTVAEHAHDLLQFGLDEGESEQQAEKIQESHGQRQRLQKIQRISMNSSQIDLNHSIKQPLGLLYSASKSCSNHSIRGKKARFAQ